MRVILCFFIAFRIFFLQQNIFRLGFVLEFWDENEEIICRFVEKSL